MCFTDAHRLQLYNLQSNVRLPNDPLLSRFQRPPTVGMLITPNCAAKAFCSSTFTLPTLARPAYSSANCSITGPTMRQGPGANLPRSPPRQPSSLLKSFQNLHRSNALLFRLPFFVPPYISFQSFPIIYPMKFQPIVSIETNFFYFDCNATNYTC